MKTCLSVEGRRGCGYRSPGKDGVGIYLVGPLGGEVCERLPYPIGTCPCCGQGVKPTRGWTWFDPVARLAGNPKCGGSWTVEKPRRPYGKEGNHDHAACPVCNPDQFFRGGAPNAGLIWVGEKFYATPADFAADGEADNAGLIWVGEKFYATPADFAKEALTMGVSRKLAALPKGFKVGKTWVFLAHRHAVLSMPVFGETPVNTPGIFQVFKPTGVDLVVKDLKRIPKKAKALAKKLGDEACRVVQVVRKEEVEAQMPLDPTAVEGGVK